MEFLMQNIRYIGIGLGMLITGLGLAPEAEAKTFTDNLMTGIGSTVSAVFYAYGLYVKWKTRAVPIKTAERIDVPTVSPVTGQTIPGNA